MLNEYDANYAKMRSELIAFDKRMWKEQPDRASRGLPWIWLGWAEIAKKYGDEDRYRSYREIGLHKKRDLGIALTEEESDFIEPIDQKNKECRESLERAYYRRQVADWDFRSWMLGDRRYNSFL